MKGTIDGIEVYLDEDQLPAFTLSVNSLTDPSKVQGVRSTTIRIISTPEARRVLGTEYMAQVGRSGTRPVLRIGDGDVDLFRAEVVPVKWTRDVIECLAVGGNASWFEYAKGVKLREADIGTSDLVAGAMQASTWTNTGGLVYFPLINFGGLSSTVTLDDLRPGVRAFRALVDMMAQGGWTVKAGGRFASVADKLVIIDPQAKPSIPIPVPVSPFNEGAYFVPSSDGVATVSFSGFEKFSFTPFDASWDGVWFRISVYDFTEKKPLAQWDTARQFYGTASYGDVLMSQDFTGIPVKGGNQYAVAVEVIGADGTILSATADMIVTWNRDSGAETFTQTPAGSFTWSMTEGGVGLEYAAGARLDIAKCLPDWTLAELIAELGIVCPLIFVTDPYSKTIVVWFDSDYFKRSSSPSRDWTQMLDHSTAPEVKMDGTQSGLSLKFSDDDDDRELWRQTFAVPTPPGWANSDIELNGVGPTQAITSKFTPTVQGVAGGVLSVPFMVDRGTPSTATYKRRVRILVADGMASGSWTFDSSPLSEYPRTYFADPMASAVLPFGNAGPNKTSDNGEWRLRVQKMRAKTLTAYFHLRDNELQDFDFGMPTLVDDGSGPAWYWVQEIKDHRFGAGLPTKVTLVKIPDVEYQAPANPPVEFPEPPEPFQCAGEGYGTYGVLAGGTGLLEITTSTGWFSTRNMATDEVVVYGDINTNGDPTEILAGDYCVYASDEAGVQSGVITTYYPSDSDTTYFTILDYTSLTNYTAFNLPHLVALPQAPNSVVTESYGNLPLVTALPSPPASSISSNYINLNQVTEIPAQHAGIEYFNMEDMPLVTTLPDFDTGAQVRLGLDYCPLLHTIGVLPQITNLIVTDCGFNTSSVVDALVNALNPSAPTGGIYKYANFNGLLSLRTSASDTNYNACISAGWTII